MQKTVMMILTENCNLACTYCYEHFKSENIMTFQTAKKIVDYELSVDDGYNEILFEFFGGEPLLEFELMKNIHDYIAEQNTSKGFLCFATTNGTCLNDRMKEWLFNNRKTMICGISLDGTPEMHNMNRCNSFEKIDTRFFSDTWPEQTCKMTISQETLPKLAEGIFYLEGLGFKVKTTFAQGINWSLEENLLSLEKALKKLVQYYYENKEKELCDFLDLNLALLNNQKEMKWCGIGVQMKAYNYNGDIYPCQSLAPITLGSELSKPFKGNNLDKFETYMDPACINCIIQPICPTCYGANYKSTGRFEIRDKSLCQFNKMCAKASAYVKYMRLQDKISTGQLSDVDVLSLRSIRKIQSL